MSSRPGLLLEDLVAWNWNLVIEDQPDPNESLRIAEVLGTSVSNRLRLTKQEFEPVLALYEPYRESVEYRLQDFDEDTQSWRDYAGACFTDLFCLTEQAGAMLKEIKAKKDQPAPATETQAHKPLVLLRSEKRAN